MANFGIGLGAFMQGVQSGASTYANITDMMDKQKLRKQQMADNDQDRADKQALRQTSQDGMTAAKANTDGQIVNVVNYYMKNTAPLMQQHFLETGDVAKADAFGKWINDANTQKGMRYSAAAMRSAQMGDADGFAENLQGAYNTYQPDAGISITGSKVNRDDKGNATGMTLTMKGKDGKEFTQDYNGMEDIYKQFSGFASPDQVWKYGQDQIALAQKTRAEAAKDGREFNQKLTLGQVDQGYKLEGQNNQSQLDRARDAEKTKSGADNKVTQNYNAQVAILKQAGKTDAEIAALTPAMLGVTNQSKPMNSRIEDYIKVQLTNDLSGGFSKLTPAEQAKQGRQAIEQIDNEANAGNATQTPGVGLPQAQQNTQGQGIPFYDTKTNTVIYR